MSGLVQRFSNSLKVAARRWLGRDPFDHCTGAVGTDALCATCDEKWPDMANAWKWLYRQVPDATAFQRYEWQQAVAELLCRPGRLRLISLWDAGDRLVGVLPLCMREDALLESIGASVSDYLEPLIHPEYEQQVWPVLLEMLSQLRRRGNKKVTLHCIRDGAPCRRLLASIAAAHGFVYEEQVTEQTPVLALPKSWEEYLGSLDAHERKETRRKLNKALTKGNARLVRCSGDAVEIAQTLHHAFALMEQAPGEKGEAIKKTVRPLLEKAAPALIREGRLWLTTLYINEEPAAVTIEFPSAAGPQLYNCGFDATKKEWSPGVVLTSMIIQKAIEGGAREFDLLRGRETYKYRLGAKDRPLWMITLRKF